MKSMIGKKWGMLTKNEKEMLLKNCWCTDAISGDIVKDGVCIIDLTDTLSIAGKIVDGEIIIEDDSIVYSPCL